MLVFFQRLYELVNALTNINTEFFLFYGGRDDCLIWYHKQPEVIVFWNNFINILEISFPTNILGRFCSIIFYQVLRRKKIDFERVVGRKHLYFAVYFSQSELDIEIFPVNFIFICYDCFI